MNSSEPGGRIFIKHISSHFFLKISSLGWAADVPWGSSSGVSHALLRGCHPSRMCAVLWDPPRVSSQGSPLRHVSLTMSPSLIPYQCNHCNLSDEDFPCSSLWHWACGTKIALGWKQIKYCSRIDLGMDFFLLFQLSLYIYLEYRILHNLYIIHYSVWKVLLLFI